MIGPHLSVCVPCARFAAFGTFCRVKVFISFVFSRADLTLDQHIGVRIPGGQPNNFFSFYILNDL